MQQKPRIIELEKKQYLSQHPDGKKLPHGIVIKEKTGIGATTVELADETRPTILVFPNKALAATKAVSASEMNNENLVYYAGSPVPSLEGRLKVLNDHIFSSLLKSKTGEIFKIAMVADTFVKYYERYKKEIVSHESLFILFDEADVYQSDASYRSSLEKCMRIYLELPDKMRCLLSATFQPHSAKEFENIDKTAVRVKNVEKQKVHLFESRVHPLSTLIQLLERHKFKKGKILVALNSVTACIYVAMKIESLQKQYKDNIGILCSDSRSPYIPKEYQTELQDGKLENHLTFITTSYFSGVDILSSANVIVCAYSDHLNDHAFLTMHRIKQVQGRVRNKLKSFSLILKMNPEYPEYKEELVKDFINYQDNIYNACVNWEGLRKPQKRDGEVLKKQREDIIKAFSYPNARARDSVRLVYYTATYWYKNLMSVDHLVMDYEATSKLYRDKSMCIEYLTKHGYDVQERRYIKEKPFDMKIYQNAVQIQDRNKREEYADAVRNPDSNNTMPEILQLKYLLKLIVDYKIENYDEEKFIIYIENNEQMKDMLRKTYRKVYLASLYTHGFTDYFSQNQRPTLEAINQATKTLLRKRLTDSNKTPIVSDFQFESKTSVKELFTGKWVLSKSYGIDTSYNVEYFSWSGCKTPDAIIQAFLKTVNKYRSSGDK